MRPKSVRRQHFNREVIPVQNYFITQELRCVSWGVMKKMGVSADDEIVLSFSFGHYETELPRMFHFISLRSIFAVRVQLACKTPCMAHPLKLQVSSVVTYQMVINPSKWGVSISILTVNFPYFNKKKRQEKEFE